MAERRVAVVGAGITGLAAAWELERHGVDVVMFEAADRIGGKLHRSRVPGLAFPLDEGADAFLARVPDALELCAEVGIDELVHPATGRAFVYARSALRPLPDNHLLGLPTDLDDLARTGLVSEAGLAAAHSDLGSTAPPPTSDTSIGSLVRQHLGDEVCDHLVGPLIGGINAGEVDQLSAAAVAPQIWACAQQGGSLIEAAADARSRVTSTGAAVFAAPADGVAHLPARIADRLRAELRLSTPAPRLAAAESGGVLVGDERVDGAIVTTPAAITSRLLAGYAPEAATALTSIGSASVVMVTLVADAAGVDHPLDGSGFLVARTEGLDITACSWGSSKWAHWNDGDHVVFRISIGHDADPIDWCGRDDAELVATAVDGLRTTMGLDLTPVGTRVGRWRDALPQYRPGHLDVVAEARAALEETGPVMAAGASLDGLGIPACIRQGRDAARSLLAR